MDTLKEIKIEMRIMPTIIQFRPLGISHPAEVWKIVTGTDKRRDWSGCCCDIESVSATLEQITKELQEIGYTPVFVP